MYNPFNLPELKHLQNLLAYIPQRSRSLPFIKSMTWVSVLQHSGRKTQPEISKPKLNNNNLVTLDMQDNLISFLLHVINQISKLQKNYSKLVAHLDTFESVLEGMKSQIVLHEKISRSNNQYFRHKFTKISGLPSNMEVR